MGLSGPKKHTKISADPNNTNWSNDTSAYGHKILTQQGWTSGSYLGAVNAPHASHYTAANASHIRVAFREDGLGLGAKIGAAAGGADTFGLSTLAGIFGRLNGKGTDQLEREEEKRRDVGLRLRYGVMGFVSGGLLVGDKIVQKAEMKLEDVKKEDVEQEDVKHEDVKQEDVKQEDVEQQDVKREDVTLRELSEKAGKRRKRNLEDENDAQHGDGKRNKRTKTDPDSEATQVISKRKRKADRDAAAAVSQDDAAVQKIAHKEMKCSKTEDSPSKSAAKSEKRARKEERRKRRERKSEKRQAKEVQCASKSTSGYSKPIAAAPESPDASVKSETVAPVPLPSQQLFGGRHAVRQRYIQQKRLASMDGRAMQEILMLKSGA